MKVSSLRGMEDILPEETPLWQHIESKARELFRLFNFQEIRTPIVEYSELFLRSIGEDSDIAQKEMYVFEDRKGRKLALRPEGTASVVRAYIEHSLFQLPSPQKFYYIGAMFRHERPQRGRQRQFHQIGVEVFGEASPKVEVELLLLLYEFFGVLNLNALTVEINSIGCKICRPKYKESLVDFLQDKKEYLCDDCNFRLKKNPLRVLDCKVQSCRALLVNCPSILDFLCDECLNHFLSLRDELDSLEIPYKVNPKIVRGLDYYTKTVFEVTTDRLGAQSAVAAGGRYDDLVEEFGGPHTPASGFAIGVERVVELIKSQREIQKLSPSVYVAFAGEGVERDVLKVATRFRKAGISTEVSFEGHSLRSQLKRADRLNCKWVVIVGEDELKRGKLRWKNMVEHTQGEATLEEIIRLVGESR